MAWRAIRAMCQVEQLAENGHKAFTGWSPKTVIVRITVRDKPYTAVGRARRRDAGIVATAPLVSVELFRGKIPMHTLNGTTGGTRVPFIHSTELEKTGLNLVRRSIVLSKTTSISGPAVLLQRVGLPASTKIQTYFRSAPVALSDCIIAIRCKTRTETQMVKSRLLRNWGQLERSYGGTCARYITLNSLREVLATIGLVERNNSNGNA